MNSPLPKQQGFSLVELTIVVVILGILATFAVPRYQVSVEKSKASEGFHYLHQLEQQQARFLATYGRYAQSKHELGSKIGETTETPRFFATSPFSSSNWEIRWSTKLTRNGPSSGFGRYTIAWNQDGFDARNSSIPEVLFAGKGTGSSKSASSSGHDSKSKKGHKGENEKKKEEEHDD